MNHGYTGGNTGYGCNALCKQSWLAAGKWEFNFRVEPHPNQFYTSETECLGFYIVTENPTYGTSYDKPEFGVGTNSFILFNIGSTSGNNDFVRLKERYDGASNTLIEDTSFDVQSSHQIKVIVDFDNEWVQLWVDGLQIGSQTNLNSNLLADMLPNSKFTINVHFHNRYRNQDAYFDDFLFYQWGGATTTTTTTTSSTTTTTTA